MVYYNDCDRFACAWLRELMKEGLIPKGDVDERSITDIEPNGLRKYGQCHFFAGISGWSLALELARYKSLRCWTGSCPCPSFSTAGKGLGFEDPRHLWPEFYRLIRQCRPPIVFGEQVENAIRFGWLDLVSADLESEGYAVGAAVLPAACVGAPHARHRLFWGARLMDDAECEGLEGLGEPLGPEQEDGGGEATVHIGPGNAAGILGDAQLLGRKGRGDGGPPGDDGPLQAGGLRPARFWDDIVWFPCQDGKRRPISPERVLFPLAHGISNRVGILRGAGNAIAPQVAAEFIRAFLDSADDCNRPGACPTIAMSLYPPRNNGSRKYSIGVGGAAEPRWNMVGMGCPPTSYGQ